MREHTLEGEEAQSEMSIELRGSRVEGSQLYVEAVNVMFSINIIMDIILFSDYCLLIDKKIY